MKNFDINELNGLELSDNEELQRMTASALLLLYQKENSIF